MYKKLIVLLVVLICLSNFCLGQNHLKILTWNIQMLPGIVNKCYNREKRCIGIIKNIKDSDYDIIVFQEVFYRQSYEMLYNGLKQEYPYQSGMPLKNHFLLANNGLLIMSKLPFKIIDYKFFNNCKGSDLFSCKGALLIEFDKNGKKFQLVATHLQADDKPKDISIRQCECEMIYDSLLKKYMKNGVVQFIVGDMNTDSVEYGNMLGGYGCLNSGLTGYTYDGVENPIVIKSDRLVRSQYDYILVRNGYFDVEKRKVVRFKYKWDKKYDDLSDHYALEGEFDY